MKKIITSTIAVLLCAYAFAQESDNRDANGNIVRGPYNKTRFIDNTFIEFQGGVNLIGNANMGQGNRAKSILPGLALDVNLGKWFNPNFGLRIGWQGLHTRWFPGSNYGWDQGVRLGYYNYAHADFLINISNWFSGYKERVWDFVPYVHVGYLASDYRKYDSFCQYVGAGAGLYNKIRLTDHLGLSLDLRLTLSRRYIMGSQIYAPGYSSMAQDFYHKLGGVATGMIGIHYNFGKTGWTRAGKSNAANAADAAIAAAAATSVSTSFITPIDDELAKVIEANAKAKAACEKANNEYSAAIEAGKDVLVDEYGNATAAIYTGKGLDNATAESYCCIADNELCPDFGAMTKEEKIKWNAAHKDILPEGWNKMNDDQKSDWVKENIFGPAAEAGVQGKNAETAFSDAKSNMVYAGTVCDDAVNMAQALYDNTEKEVDANENVLPASYNGLNDETAQVYANIANTEACPDITAMKNSEVKAWAKEHKDILPKNWKKMSAQEKEDWVTSNIYAPAQASKSEKAQAKEQLDEALARQKEQYDAIAGFKDNDTQKNKTEYAAVDVQGYFSIGKSEFTKKQMNDWKASIKDLDKTRNYIITGYSDVDTGSARRNVQIRRMRAAYVKNLLQKEGFVGNISIIAAEDPGIYVEKPTWKNMSAVIR